MIVIGLLYLLLGIVNNTIGNLRDNFTVIRISYHFIMVGSFNIAIFAASFFIDFIDKYQTSIAAISVCIFAILILFEYNKEYRRYRNILDKYDREDS
jgi:hypothetical protein